MHFNAFQLFFKFIRDSRLYAEREKERDRETGFYPFFDFICDL